MRALLTVLAVLVTAPQEGCDVQSTSSDVQRERQETLVSEGVAEVGMPSIKNFRELKLAKDLYELRDQTGLVTYSYLWSDMQGKLTFFCDSIGYPIPYSTQYSAPESMQRYLVQGGQGVARNYGVTRLPQAEPNGLFSPGAAEGTWIMCKEPEGKDVRPIYVEPRVVVSPFKLKI